MNLFGGERGMGKMLYMYSHVCGATPPGNYCKLDALRLLLGPEIIKNYKFSKIGGRGGNLSMSLPLYEILMPIFTVALNSMYM